jgi:dTDP-4-amino-4,6-dideoxygalactose transaminase
MITNSTRQGTSDVRRNYRESDGKEVLLVAEPCLGSSEKEALAEVIDSGWITMGNQVRAFERNFAVLHQMEEAVAVCSCTAGLHLALQAIAAGPGDEVLVPALTFVATVNTVLYTGATPVFVDIESVETPIMSFADAARKCTPRTKAVVIVHYGGYVADLEQWRAFADERGLYLIEDSAHAVGSARGPIIGDVAVFSFFGNKNMTTAEGGMVVALDPAILENVRQARGHGMTSCTTERLASGLVTYDVTMLGFNYRMDDLRAAVGLVQLKQVDDWNRKRRVHSDAYRGLLDEHCPGVIVPFSASWPSTHHIMPVVLPKDADRQRVADRLRSERVHTTNHYPPAHWFSWYRERFPSVRLPVTEEFATRELTLPLHPGLNAEQVRYVACTLAGALNH